MQFCGSERRRKVTEVIKIPTLGARAIAQHLRARVSHVVNTGSVLGTHRRVQNHPQLYLHRIWRPLLTSQGTRNVYSLHTYHHAKDSYTENLKIYTNIAINYTYSIFSCIQPLTHYQKIHNFLNFYKFLILYFQMWPFPSSLSRKNRRAIIFSSSLIVSFFEFG